MRCLLLSLTVRAFLFPRVVGLILARLIVLSLFLV